MDIIELTALELGKKIASKEISAAEAVKAQLERIKDFNSEINAYITVMKDGILRQAQAVQKRIDSGEACSPLAGVPAAIKDNICTKGVKTSCASKILGDFQPPYSATVVEKLERAGAVFTGKANLDEFAMGSTNETSYYGAVKNPWNTGYVPGGSSGGSAAAVASGMAVYALGSDTGGSIRQPSSYCGVTGLKPTYGTVSRYGLVAFASSLDQIGPIARDAADCAAVLDLICGKDKNDGTSLDRQYGGYLNALTGNIEGLKVGIPDDCFGDGLDGKVANAVLKAADTLKALGAVVERFEMPIYKYAVPAYYIVASAEASSNLSRYDGVKYGWRAEEYEDLVDMYLQTRSQGFGDEVKRRIMLGNFVLSTGYYDAYYKKGLQVKSIIKKAFDNAFSKYDVILTPTAPTTAPKLGQSLTDPLKMYLSDIYTVPVNLAGLPGLSMPCGFDEVGLPIGAQLIGPAFGEDKILSAAHAFQINTDYHKKRPGEVR